MYLIVLITVLVHSNIVISAEIVNNSPDGKALSSLIVVSALSNTQFQNFTATENSTLHLKVTDIEEQIPIKHKLCTGLCNINGLGEPQSKIVSCKIISQINTQHLNVTVNNHLLSASDSNWACTFDIINPPGNKDNITIPSLEVSFFLNVLKPSPPPPLGWGEHVWTYIIAAVIVLIILIIIGQTICIIHFRRKAKAVRIHASLSKRSESIEETVRYSRMPAQKIIIEPCGESRESGIYEVLEKSRVLPVPEPPSLKTLPRNDASHRVTSPTVAVPEVAVLATAAPSTSTASRTLTNGTLLPFTLRKKQMDSDSDKKRSTIDRIKNRPPLPIPSEDIYEVMEVSPTAVRKEAPKKEIAPKKEAPKKELAPKKEVTKKDTFPKPEVTKQGAVPKKEVTKKGVAQRDHVPPKPKPGLQTNVKNGANVLKPQISPSQLRAALELRSRVNTIEATPRVIPFNPGLSPPVTSAPIPAEAPRPALAGTGRPCAGRAPPPGPSAPGATGPGANRRPPLPNKPKQLHPLPQPPSPESAPVTTEGEGEKGCSSDEEWIYEPLKDLSSFNIYSNS